jgi:hypothetical protein
MSNTFQIRISNSIFEIKGLNPISNLGKTAGFAMIGDSAVDLVFFFGRRFLLLLVQLDLFILTAAGAALAVDCTAEGNAIKSMHVKKESRHKCEIRIRNTNAAFDFEIRNMVTYEPGAGVPSLHKQSCGADANVNLGCF